MTKYTTEQMALRAGLGFRPEDPVPSSTEEWIDTQLNKTLGFRGLVTSQTNLPTLIDWPADFEFSLEQRIRRMQAQERRRLEIDDMRISDSDRAIAHGQNWEKYDMTAYDRLKFFHSGCFDDAQISFRLALFWFNHFTIGEGRNSLQYAGDYWQNSIVKNLNGRFSNLLLDAIAHPAMLSYLDNVSNIGENSLKANGCTDPDCVIGFNDNLARELLELHTLGSSFGYTEDDIRETAKILTGWGLIFHLPEPEKFNITDYRRPWYYPHAEFGTKRVLGKTFPEGPDGLIELIDFLARHPATINRLSEKMAAHFLGDDISTNDIDAIVKTWTETDGDLMAIHRTLLERIRISDATKLDWPLVWAFRLIRSSGSKLVWGLEDMKNNMYGIEQDPGRLMEELGNSFWVSRQPNGYSESRADWLSTEHLDRRFRFSSLVAKGGLPTRNAFEIAQSCGFGTSIIELLQRGRDMHEQLILLACSKQFMEV